MPIIDTPLEGLKIFQPRIFEDERGYFFESYNEQVFKEAGLTAHFVQDNQSKSVYGTVRGLHYQVPPYAQCKLVRCIQGEVLDVVVDIREGSATYGQSFSILLSATNFMQLYIPHGFAHGFAVVTETAIFAYKCDNFYSKESEGALFWNDAQIGIDWNPLDMEKVILSEKDKTAPFLGAHRKFEL